MSVAERILKHLRSQKLALLLLLILAGLALVGTPYPVEQAEKLLGERVGEGLLPAARALGLVDTYRSPLFITLLVLFTVNIALCTWHRFSLRLKSAGREKGNSRRRVRLWLDVLMHLSVIVILLGGAVKGLLATVGTQYLFVGVPAETVYDWGLKGDVPLGFTLLMKERVEDYYPLQLQVGVNDAETGEKLSLLEPREGRPALLPGGDLRVSVGTHDIDARWVILEAESGGRRESFRLEIVPGGNTKAEIGGYGLSLVAWRRDLRRVRGLVTVIDGGREVKEQWLYPNGRIGYKGTSVFLTAWGVDDYRNPYIGVQVTRDPGALIFWIGATILAITLPLFLLSRKGVRS